MNSTTTAIDSHGPTVGTNPRTYTPARSVYQPFDLDTYLDRGKFSQEAIDYIHAAETQRSRHPNGYLSNTVHVPCEKYGYAVIAESRGYEYPSLLTALFDPHVLRVWDQPPTQVISGVTKEGVRFRFTTTPDFLVVAKDSVIEVWEIKPVTKVAKGCIENPNRYQCDDQGKYQSEAAQEHFKRLGFRYRIITEVDLDPVVVATARFLFSYISGLPDSPITEEEYRAFIDAARKVPGITLDEIEVDQKVRRREVFYYLVAKGEIFIDLKTADMNEPENIRLFSTAVDQHAFALLRTHKSTPANLDQLGYHLQPGASLQIKAEAFEIAKVLPGSVVLRDQHGNQRTCDKQVLLDLKPLIGGVFNAEKTFEALYQESPIEDRTAYLKRRETIMPYLPGGARVNASPSGRTERRWLHKYRLEGELGLLPKHYRCGHRGSRMDPLAEKHLNLLIEKSYLAKGSQVSGAWLYLQLVEAKKNGEFSGELPTERTVYRRVKKLNRFHALSKRAGRRVALACEPIAPTNVVAGSPHGTRDFSVAHIDSTTEDILLKESETSDKSRRWNISKMVDAYTGEVLAFYRYEGPTDSGSIRQVLRNCVSSHGRLPRLITCDWGSEHNNVWLIETLLRIGVILLFRQKSSPRKGAPVESKFSVWLKELYRNLDGTTVLLKNAKMLTKAMDPAGFATWTDDMFSALVEEYVHLTNNIERKAKPSPFSLREACTESFGPSPGVGISLDHLDDILMPFTKRRVHKVSERGTIRVGKRTYSHPDLMELCGAKVVVRTSEKNPGIVYVAPPNRMCLIPCELADQNPITDQIMKRARTLDQQRLGKSPIPGVSTSTILRAGFVGNAVKCQDQLRQAAKEGPRIKQSQPSHDDQSLPIFTFTKINA